MQAVSHNQNTLGMYLMWAHCVGKQQLGTDGWVGNSSHSRPHHCLNSSGCRNKAGPFQNEAGLPEEHGKGLSCWCCLVPPAAASSSPDLPFLLSSRVARSWLVGLLSPSCASYAGVWSFASCPSYYV